MANLPLIIDIREACRPQKTGKAQWTRGLVEEFIKRSLPLRLLTDTPAPPAWASSAEVVMIPGHGLQWHVAAARTVRASEGSTFLSPTSYILPAMLGRAAPCVPVVHDLIAFRGEPHDRKAQFIEYWTLGPAVRNAASILTVSESTKRDLLEKFPRLDPARIHPVYAGPMRSDPPMNQSDGKTILCVATLCPRKNQLRLIKAFASLPPAIRTQHQLLLVGARGWDDAEIIRLAQTTEGVEWRGYVDDAAYEQLLSTCTIFAMPSLYEGFGMQILDALQRGIPVLTSDTGSLPEVTGGAAETVDPLSIESIAAGLRRLLESEDRRAELCRMGPEAAGRFNWKRTADLVLAALLSP